MGSGQEFAGVLYSSVLLIHVPMGGWTAHAARSATPYARSTVLLAPPPAPKNEPTALLAAEPANEPACVHRGCTFPLPAHVPHEIIIGYCLACSAPPPARA